MNKTIILVVVNFIFFHYVAFTCPSDGRTTNSYYADKSKVGEIYELQAEKLREFLTLFKQALTAEQQGKIAELKLDYKPYFEPNACAGNNKITVLDGLTLFVGNDDELAFVLAHELGHILENHYVKSVAKSIVATVAANATAVALSSAAGGGAAGGVAGNISGQIVGGAMMGAFSRPQEQSADEWAVKLLFKTGFDVRRASKLMDKWIEYMPQSNIPNFFSTHPMSTERREEVLSLLQKLEALEVATVFSSLNNVSEINQKLMQYQSQINRKAFLEDAKAKFEIYGQGKVNPNLNSSQLSMDMETIGFCLDDSNGKKPKDRVKNVFVSNRKVFWYADYKFSSLRDFKNAFAKPKFKAEWYAPDGSLFAEDVFTFVDYADQYLFSKLEWDSELGNYLLGRWRVRVTSEDKLIDERSFEILK